MEQTCWYYYKKHVDNLTCTWINSKHVSKHRCTACFPTEIFQYYNDDIFFYYQNSVALLLTELSQGDPCNIDHATNLQLSWNMCLCQISKQKSCGFHWISNFQAVNQAVNHFPGAKHNHVHAFSWQSSHCDHWWITNPHMEACLRFLR